MNKINLLILLLAASLSEGYKPVFIIHGLFEHSSSLNDLKSFIQQSHPGTIVKIPNIYTGLRSLKELSGQIRVFGRLVKEFSSEHKDGFHLIGFSQGGIIARAVLQTTPGLNIESFIALSSPINGQFGDTSYIPFLPRIARRYISYLMYTSFWQRRLSLANYWRDPQKSYLYRKYSSVLAPLNNQSYTNNGMSWKWRENFLRIKKLVLIGGPQDGVITPWQSALMGFYDSNLRVLNMEELEEYQKDSFGLKTLDESGRVERFVFPGVEHTHFHKNRDVFTRAIEPHLV